MASSSAATPTPASNTSGTSPATPPGLLEATTRSTTLWQDDLQLLFEQAKDRYPDVVWELSDDDDGSGTAAEEVWGHKGEFQACYRVVIVSCKCTPDTLNDSLLVQRHEAHYTGILPCQSSLLRPGQTAAISSSICLLDRELQT
jgi:hypothetical protein